MSQTIINKIHYVDIPERFKGDKTFYEILKIECGFWECSGRDSAIQFISKHYAPEGQILCPTDAGFWITISKKDYFKIAIESKPWERLRYNHVNFVKLSKDTAMINYKILAENDEETYTVMICSIYQKFSDGTWKVLTCQQNLPYSPGFSSEGLKQILDN